jgi:MFS family permease
VIPTSAATATPYVSGRRKIVLLVSLSAVLFSLLALYAAVLAVLLPNQIQLLVGSAKTTALATVFAITSVFSSIATPVAGAFSDRTRSRFGRRSPWIFTGALIGGGSLALVPYMPSLVWIIVAWIISAVALNAMQAAITTIVADRLAPAERGLASGLIGAGMTAGGTVGIIIGGMMGEHIALAYELFAGWIAFVSVIFVVLNSDRPSDGAPPPKFDIGGFLSGFWIDPRKSPDFAWAFMGRFVIYMGYQSIVTYLFYILQDYIHLSRTKANITISHLSEITFVALVCAALAAGWVSDRIARRKPLVFAGSFIMALAVAAPLLAPNIQGMLLYAGLIGLGYGAFMSVDLALMTQVLPDSFGESTGRDLGILTTAINIPQILSPVFAAWLLSISGHDYRSLFIASAAFIVAGSLFVLPIRSVR